MEKKQYDIANLSNTDLHQISTLETILSKEKGEEVILIAIFIILFVFSSG